MFIETKDFDIFGVPFMFTTNKNQYFKSFFGGVISIISLFIVLVATFTTSRDLFLRSQPRILIENYPLKEIPFYNISNENFFLAFRIESSSGLMDELKNYFTGQNVENAIKQYRYDRDQREPLFAFKRCLVHFAVDNDLVYMTTRLAGKSTFFLPFNKGFENGAGNPVNPSGFKSAYLWEEVLQKESLLQLLFRFPFVNFPLYFLEEAADVVPEINFGDF